MATNSKRVSDRLKNKLSEFRNREWNFVSVAADTTLNTPMRELERLRKVRRRAEGELDPHQPLLVDLGDDEPVQAITVSACGKHACAREREGG